MSEHTMGISSAVTRNTALRLLQKYKTLDRVLSTPAPQFGLPRQLQFAYFKKTYIPLLSIFYVVSFTLFWRYRWRWATAPIVGRILSYYANLTRHLRQHHSLEIPRVYFNTLTVNNMLIFSKPKRQMFVLFFKEKPVFIFTGGLMRFVINEKRRSSKRLYKVATSLIKLAVILTATRNFFNSYALRLVNIGTIRTKIITSLSNVRTPTKIHYVVILFRRNCGAQKFNTRRSIKKYILKRFKVRTK